MKLTKQEAIENHRKMWNWIADETLRRKHAVNKEEYFNHFNIESKDIPRCECYCCEYVFNRENHVTCNACPVVWGNDKTVYCLTDSSLFYKWECIILFLDLLKENYLEAAELARQIANLPERK